MVARVEHLVGNTLGLQDPGQSLRLFDRHRADQHWLISGAALLDLLDDGVVLFFRRAIDLIVMVLALDRDVGRNLDHFHPVDLAELPGFGHRRAGHAGKLGVEPEVVLEGDGGERLVFLLDGRFFLGLDRLVQALGVAPALHHAARELVDDDDLVVFDDVVGIPSKELMGLEGLVDVMQQRHVLDIVERAAFDEAAFAQQLLGALDAGIGQADGARLLVLLVVLFLEMRNERVDRPVQFGGVFRRARDDEWSPRFVDQDGIDLVDDREVELSLDHVFQTELHVVPQVVEAVFVVRPVGYVAGILGAALLVGKAMNDAADRQSEELVYLAHPNGIALRQVVVDGDDMHALA